MKTSKAPLGKVADSKFKEAMRRFRRAWPCPCPAGSESGLHGGRAGAHLHDFFYGRYADLALLKHRRGETPRPPRRSSRRPLLVAEKRAPDIGRIPLKLLLDHEAGSQGRLSATTAPGTGTMIRCRPSCI